MKYDGYKVYKYYLGVKLHFTSKNYDYAKYEGQVNTKLETFVKRNDRYFFHKLSTRYSEDNIIDYFVSNFLANSKRWIGNLQSNDGHEEYLKFKKYKDAFNYHFRSDIVLVSNDMLSNGISFDDMFSVFNGQHPRLLRLYLQKKISIQTMVVLDYFLSYTKRWNKEITDKVVWPDTSHKIKKVKTFIEFNPTETKMILKEVIVNG